ncbi:Gfo/Idh/MocA family oxidoreductase [Danxiaibacter flavus]|uniref:Gfo/Idh/MocA family oxidoreductase n=1 Tax=Danxiaibacter flavus TaxID=3049108 RepID=A0ABV3ZN48_9BACT|nr:Gfo/Idh/MocA family oxidoreductase [Chitinophagaceae bacterium DXS]
MNSRRTFLKNSAKASAAIYLSSAFSAKSYARIIGANDRVNVGVVGFSDRFKSSLLPGFMAHKDKMNFDMIAVSDLWKVKRENGQAFLKQKLDHDITACRNNDELYAIKDIDAVFVSTADFQHSQHCAEAVRAGRDAYVEKPFAETMEDARAAIKAVRETKKIVQIGSQRRSGRNYKAAEQFVKSGKFGDILKVELTWNVNQPARWRRNDLVAQLKEEDTDWKRWLLNRPFEKFDPRKYLEFRLFWPYSSGLAGQWMSHQIDTVHWFSGLKHPRSVVANGGIYTWKDGRRNWDTITAVFDYGPQDDASKGFQVTFASRMGNGDDDPGEIYYSNGGELNLMNNKISPKGGLSAKAAGAMQLQANLLPEMNLSEIEEKVSTSANTGGDSLTLAHVGNWMECVRSRQQPNASVEAGYSHSIATIMTNAAVQTGQKATFDEKTQEVMAGGKVFRW